MQRDPHEGAMMRLRTKSRSRWYHAVLCAVMLGGVGLPACAPTDEGRLPPNVQDPARFRTPAGALALYRGALLKFPGVLDSFVVETGVLTDELVALPLPPVVSGAFTAWDSRRALLQPRLNYYLRWHTLRAQAREARSFVATYDTSASSVARQSLLYGLEGYAEVFLADLYCSGIPLSTVDYGKDYTLTPGLRTAEVYAHAARLFDSAMALTHDSVEYRYLSAVGRGRALLAIDSFAAAAAAVQGVPDGFVYQMIAPPGLLDSFALQYASNSLVNGSGNGTPSVAEREGGSGLPYRSSADPRVQVDTLGPDLGGNTMYFPHKYPPGAVTLTLASSVEARLIEAEALLHTSSGDGQWLQKLNQLRQTVGLADTTDPGSDSLRVDLVFRERAFWLYLTGHRQGDLRRLIRQYGRIPAFVYPTGSYQGGSDGIYGEELVVPVPESERALNPKYTGCDHRRA